MSAITPETLYLDTRFNKTTRENLKKYGNIRVKTITIRRAPISGKIEGLLNILSIFSWEKAKQEQGYDKVFHLSMLVRLVTGETLTLEKNSNISFKVGDAHPNDRGGQVLGPLPIYGSKTVNQVLIKYRDVIPGFFVYSAFKNNCQDFLYNVCKGFGVLDGEYGSEIGKFIKQDIEQVAAKVPGFLDKMTRIITDLTAIVDRNVNEYTGIDYLGLKKGGVVLRRRKRF